MDSAVEHVVLGDGHFCRVEVDITMPTDESRKAPQVSSIICLYSLKSTSDGRW